MSIMKTHSTLRVVLMSLVLAMSFSAATSAKAESLDFSGTFWEEVAQKHDLRPTLLYSLAIAESGIERQEGTISPWPWVIRAPDTRGYYDTKAEALKALKWFQSRYGEMIDIGMGQVNIRWNGHRVDRPEQLMDPKTNLEVMAQILSEAIDSTDNPELGIGRYYTWSDESRAKRYGKRVLAIEKGLLSNSDNSD